MSSSSSSGNGAAAAVVEQYEAQKHVLEQLQDKIQTLLRQAPPQHTAVIKLSRDFQKIQQRARQLHEVATRRLTQAPPPLKSHVEEALRSSSDLASNPTTNSYQQQQQLQLMEDRLHEQLMREREAEIRNINQGMHTVNEIYKDLAHIVSEQQEGIDQIETQMEDSRANAEQGLKQVEVANEKYGTTNCQIM
jgi:t-SNARE complex subunit (syntaxin)